MSGKGRKSAPSAAVVAEVPVCSGADNGGAGGGGGGGLSPRLVMSMTT